MLLGYLVLGGFFWADLLRAVAEDAVLVIGVMKFGARRADVAAHQKKDFGSSQHATVPDLQSIVQQMFNKFPVQSYDWQRSHT